MQYNSTSNQPGVAALQGGPSCRSFCGSLASHKRIGLEGELAYHRDSDEYTIHTITAMIGPQAVSQSESAEPFLHFLFGVRYEDMKVLRVAAGIAF